MCNEEGLIPASCTSFAGMEKKVKRTPRGQGDEAKRTAAMLQGFDIYTSPVYQYLIFKFSSGVSHKELYSIAQIVSMNTQIPLQRAHSRDFRVLVKWFSDNWEKVFPIVNIINLRDENNEIISLSREINSHNSAC